MYVREQLETYVHTLVMLDILQVVSIHVGQTQFLQVEVVVLTLVQVD